MNGCKLYREAVNMAVSARRADYSMYDKAACMCHCQFLAFLGSIASAFVHLPFDLAVHAGIHVRICSLLAVDILPPVRTQKTVTCNLFLS